LHLKSALIPTHVDNRKAARGPAVHSRLASWCVAVHHDGARLLIRNVAGVGVRWLATTQRDVINAGKEGSHICGSPAPSGLQLSNEKTAFREDLTTTGRSGLARPSVYAGSSCSRNTADIDRALLVMIIFV
jgi:hypothetical protein